MRVRVRGCGLEGAGSVRSIRREAATGSESHKYIYTHPIPPYIYIHIHHNTRTAPPLHAHGQLLAGSVLRPAQQRLPAAIHLRVVGYGFGGG